VSVIKSLFPHLPPTITESDVLACTVTVRFDAHMQLYRYHVVTPHGERWGGCSDEPGAIEQAAWELADCFNTWKVGGAA